MHQGQRWKTRYPWRLCAIVLLVFTTISPAGPIEKFTDYEYQDKPNNNDTLVFFFAGLHGEESWRQFTALMNASAEFANIDYLAYYSPTALNIEENIQRAQTILNKYREQYTKTIYVGHSIGGIMIKRSLMRAADKGMTAGELPQLVITFGTPFDMDKFTVSLFARLGARVFWPSVDPLEREVFNLERLKQINSSWRTAIKSSPLRRVKMVSVFGVEDEIAQARYEGSSANTIFIEGDHLGIISPQSNQACSWQVFRSLLLAEAGELQTLDCILPPSAAQ